MDLKHLKYKESIIFIASLIPIIFQSQLFFKLPSKIIYVPYIMITFLFIFFKVYKIRISMKCVLITLNLIIAYIFMPIISFNIGFSDFSDNLFYTFLNLFMIISLSTVSYNISKNDYDKLLRWSLKSNSFILILAIISNINQINKITLSGIFLESRISRANFNLGHPNFAALFLVIEIILIYLVIFKRDKKVIGLLWIILFCIPLLCTGSRTGIFSIIIFFISELILVSITNEKIGIKGKVLIAITLIIVIVGALYNSKILSYLIENSSGRDFSAIENIKLLIENRKILFGYGPVQISNMKYIIKGLHVSDNWYISHLVRYGIISLCLIMISIIVILQKCMKKIDSNNTYIISLIIMILFYSGAENVLFVPGVCLSWITWIILYSSMELI